MKDFEWKFLEIVPKKMYPFRIEHLEILPVLSISGKSRWQEDSSVVYTSFGVSLSWPFSFSAHLDRTLYKKGSYIIRHSDLTDKLYGKEWRVIVILKDAEKGGQLLADKFILNWPRLKIINTRVPHEVTKIEEGERRVLLFGIYIAPFNNIKPPA